MAAIVAISRSSATPTAHPPVPHRALTPGCYARAVRRGSKLGIAGWIFVLALGCTGETTESKAEPVAEPKPSAAEPEPDRKSEGGLASAMADRTAAIRAAQEVPTDPEIPPPAEPEPPAPEPGLLAPTEAELRAWDRKDPEAEKHLYEWDEDNLDTMLGYVRHLECRRLAVIEAGEAFQAGTSSESDWLDFKRDEVRALDTWQKQLFVDHPRIVEKSKLIGQLLELHELVLYGLPKAFNAKDATERAKADAHWMVVIAKVDKYATRIGGTFDEATADDCNEGDGTTG